ncbi:MAG: hypothetical protein JW754_05305 [Candidatus Aenigmarchaeota archaeon]|nr:hypothetical protein [Candidatus Aenigmarchaeota archaeon]
MVILLAFSLPAVRGEEMKILDIPGKEMECQMTGENECRLINNIIMIRAELLTDYSEFYTTPDLQLSGDLRVYPQVCDYYYRKGIICSMEIQPVIEISGMKEYTGTFSLSIKKDENTTEVLSVPVSGIKITPIRKSVNFSLRSDLGILTQSVKDGIKGMGLDTGFCFQENAGFLFGNNLASFNKNYTTLTGSTPVFVPVKNNITLTESYNSLVSFLGSPDFFSLYNYQTYETSSLIYTGFMFYLDIYSVFLPKSTRTLVQKNCENLENRFSLIFSYIFSNLYEKKFMNSGDPKYLEKIKYFSGIASNAVQAIQKPRFMIYLDNRLLRDEYVVCRDTSIKIEYSNIEPLGIEKVYVMGPGEQGDCDTDHSIYGGTGSRTFAALDFICNQNDLPVNGETYFIFIRPGSGQEILYPVKYYEQSEMCTVRQMSVGV